MNIRSLLATTFLITSAVFVPVSAYAVAATPPKPTVTMEKSVKADAETAESVMPAKVEYALPYPGILPDHPLYFLKDLRDLIFERLIADPVRKTEFYILQADKRMNMAVFLKEKGKEDLALESLEKSKMFMEKGIQTATSLKSQGKEVPAYIREKFTNALAKHSEVVSDLVGKSSESAREKFVNVQNQLKDLQAQANELK